ncbi:unnamed protein product [Somion occarium]|uniref:Uncharacterized protein n=1 Tax=Somion occarium TaxID=3059160 RepID=A0ABP1E344_9APHY
MPTRAPESSGSVDPSTLPAGVAVGTKVGMVLGVLCLFALVTAYQFIPRRRKPPSRNHALFTPSRPKKPTFLQRLHTYCSTFLQKFKGKPKPNAGINPTERRGRLRSFYLPDERQRKREQIKQKFATSLRLNLHTPHIPKNPFHSPTSSPPLRPSRRYAVYTQLYDDDEGSNRPVKPASALISPWSSNEEDFPPLHPFRSPLPMDEVPATPPPLFPPPPVYVPETPLRGGNGIVDTPPIRFRDTPDDVSAQSLIDVVTIMIKQQDQFPGEGQENPFIIAEEDEWDSDSESEYSNRSHL